MPSTAAGTTATIPLKSSLPQGLHYPGPGQLGSQPFPLLPGPSNSTFQESGNLYKREAGLVMPPTYPVAAPWAGLQSRLLATLTGSTGSGRAHRSHPTSAAPSSPGLSWGVGRGSSSQPLSLCTCCSLLGLELSPSGFHWNVSLPRADSQALRLPYLREPHPMALQHVLSLILSWHPHCRKAACLFNHLFVFCLPS